jgi:glycosyltransferase involved in cell wall biosynthesis
LSDPPVVLVVPCYNEERRIDAGAFLEFARSGRVHLLFVNDGSADGTARVLSALREEAPGQVDVLPLERNVGKAEAVRLGLRQALDRGASIVGYFDADLSTPPDQVLRLVDAVAGHGGLAAALGSRVARLGAQIERGVVRHYLGRVFATAASWVLQVAVYDTQCGAKCFRASPAVRAALDDPFVSRWVFDVELLGRLLSGAPGVAPVGVDAFVEVPLERWRDVGGSKLGLRAMGGAAVDLLRVRQELRARRRGAPHQTR